MSENRQLRDALDKINDIRNSIIGFQKMNWSEHIYPLVAALEEAGIKGAGYPESREYVGTMLERTLAAEAEVERLEKALETAREALERTERDRDYWKVESEGETAKVTYRDRIIAKAREDAIEEAAKVADKMKTPFQEAAWHGRNIAATIRALSQKKKG